MKTLTQGKLAAWITCSIAGAFGGCGGEVYDFRTQQDSAISTGGNGSGGAGTTPDPSGGLHGTPQGGTTGDAVNAYRRGGYAGGEHVVVTPEGPVDLGNTYSDCTQNSSAYSSAAFWDAPACRAGTLCTPACETNADCPSGGSGAPSSECRAATHPYDGTFCVLPCQADADCPSEMLCLSDLQFGMGKTCMFAETPWYPGCKGYCAIDGAECSADVPCCDGLQCAPWGTCEAVQCLEFAWPCDAAGPACCDGLSCRDGYCQTG